MGGVPAGWLSLPRPGFQHESGKEKVRQTVKRNPCNLRKNKRYLRCSGEVCAAGNVLQEYRNDTITGGRTSYPQTSAKTRCLITQRTSIDPPSIQRAAAAPEGPYGRRVMTDTTSGERGALRWTFGGIAAAGNVLFMNATGIDATVRGCVRRPEVLAMNSYSWRCTTGLPCESPPTREAKEKERAGLGGGRGSQSGYKSWRTEGSTAREALRPAAASLGGGSHTRPEIHPSPLDYLLEHSLEK